MTGMTMLIIAKVFLLFGVVFGVTDVFLSTAEEVGFFVVFLDGMMFPLLTNGIIA